MRKTEAGSSGTSNQRDLKLRARTKAAHKELKANNHHGGKQGNRNARRPVTHAEGAVADHRTPIVENRFFQPDPAVKRGRDPVMARKHLARNLRVAGFVGAYDTEGGQSIEKEECAENSGHHPLMEPRFALGQVHEGYSVPDP